MIDITPLADERCVFNIAEAVAQLRAMEHAADHFGVRTARRLGLLLLLVLGVGLVVARWESTATWDCYGDVSYDYNWNNDFACRRDIFDFDRPPSDNRLSQDQYEEMLNTREHADD